MEITDLNAIYLQKGKLDVEILGQGFTWLDTGTHESLAEATEFVKTVEIHQQRKIACLEIAYRNQWISKEQLEIDVIPFKKTNMALIWKMYFLASTLIETTRENMTKNIVITGGAGFIGANFVYMLDKYPEYKLTNLDLLTYAGDLDSIKSVEKFENYKFVKGDIADRLAVFELFEREKFDVVVNFAAESHVDRSISNPDVFIQTNFVGTEVLLEASRNYGVKRYHQVSTDEVYGDLPLEDKELLFSETSMIKPSSPYSATKAAADLLVQAYGKTYGLPITISRCSNNYGPYQFPEKLIPLMILKALKGESLPVYGDGKNIRDWLYVKDHCRAIDMILHEGTVGEVYNIGGHNERSNIEIVKLILKKLQKPMELISHVDDRLGHDLRYGIDPKKIQSELHWEPQVMFEDGIETTIQWYLDNKWWWERILSGEYMEK